MADYSQELIEHLTYRNIELTKAIKKLIQERDAAIKDLNKLIYRYKECGFCKNADYFSGCRHYNCRFNVSRSYTDKDVLWRGLRKHNCILYKIK